LGSATTVFSLVQPLQLWSSYLQLNYNSSRLEQYTHPKMSKYPDHLSSNPTPTKGQKSRARREPSGVFSLFQAPQIQQFKEAFQLIDHDKDGWVNESDLTEIFTSLGWYISIHQESYMLNVRIRHRPFQADDG